MRYTVFIVLILFGADAFSQGPLPTPVNVKKAYERGTRSADGNPGKRYWQNTANYDLKIQYDPASRLLSGVVDVVYVNNSPDTLRQVRFKLYPNYYKKGAPRQAPVEPEDLSDGVQIDSLYRDNNLLPSSALQVDFTNGILRNSVIIPGQKISFHIVYHYTLNKGSHMRTGEIEAGAAFIAYSFPRIAVYDDIDGWNTYPYLGTQEFYNDFCHFSAAITVPRDFLVWATGELRNAEEVLSPEYVNRIKQAESGDALIYIVDSTDLRKGGITATGKSFTTWHFDADDVTDFAFALSDHYLWQASSVKVDPRSPRRTRVDAVFNPRHQDYFNVALDARKTVEAMSYRFPAWPFPYQHITVFDGLDQMEYPMMVNDNPVQDRAESISLTDHEIFHTMFPFYMGINETKYAWMDEGWATIGEWLISPMIDSTIVDDYGVAATAAIAGKETDLPVTTLSTEMNRSYFTNSYPKPAMGYLFVKDYLGDALFTKALHHYINQWKGKHPLPNDFFYCMNAGSGKNLNWFWKRWFFETGVPDLAIQSVKKSGNKTTVVIANKGGKPVPVHLTVTYDDGTTAVIHRTIGVWEKGAATATVVISSSKTIQEARLFHPHVPDSNPSDNQYGIHK